MNVRPMDKGDVESTEFFLSYCFWCGKGGAGHGLVEGSEVIAVAHARCVVGWLETEVGQRVVRGKAELDTEADGPR